MVMSSMIVLPGDGERRYWEVALSGCPVLVAGQRGWTVAGAGGTAHRGAALSHAVLGAHPQLLEILFGEKISWDGKRRVRCASRSTVHLEQPCEHAGSSVRWVTVMDRRKSSATAVSEQTALVIRLEM